jgi:hypothetical protein
LIAKALVVWLLLAVLAPLNGAVRNAWLTPRIGEPGGHLVSTFTLCAVILLVALATIRWIGPGSGGDAALIGVLWVLLTVTFEFVAGHYAFGTAWGDLLADYNVVRGRVWVLVLVMCYLAPGLALRLRGA